MFSLSQGDDAVMVRAVSSRDRSNCDVSSRDVSSCDVSSRDVSSWGLVAVLVRISAVLLLMICGMPDCVAWDDDLSVEQVNAALEIASSTAHALRRPALAAGADDASVNDTAEAFEKLQQVSTSAVARALQFGPPSRSETEASQPLIFRSVVVDINQNIPRPTVETFRQGLPRRLWTLSRNWRQHRVRPELAYEALRVCVNPARRPDRLFLYAKEADNDRFPAFSEPESAAHELIWWAVQADQIENLKQSLNDQQLEAVAEGCFLFFLLAIEADDESAIRKRCQQLQMFVQQASDPSLLRLLAVSLMKAEPSVRQLPEASLLLQRTAETLLAVDGQTVAQANFAATAAVDGFSLAVSQVLKSEDKKQQSSSLVDLANRVLVNHRLPEPLQVEFRAAIADQILTAGFVEIALIDPVKSAVAERQLRFWKDRWLVPVVNQQQEIGPDDQGIVSVDWNPKSSPDPAAIWVQQAVVDDLGAGQISNLFTISGLISVGSPSTNFDGSVLAFHGRTAGSAMGSGNHVYVVDRNLKTITDIGSAVNPSLTATGRRLTCSRYTPNKGVWFVRSDGSNWQQLDEAGWASKFSSDGTQVGYTVMSKGKTAIVVYDLVSHCLRPENVKQFARPEVDDQAAAVTGWPFCWAKAGEASGGSYFWWLNGKDKQLLKYPVQHWMMDKYLAKKRISDVVNVVQDLNSLADDQLVWLGPISSIKSDLGLWKTGWQTPFTIDGRQLLGATVSEPDQVVLFSRAKPSSR